MQIIESTGDVGFRIGGLPPNGVLPNYADELTHYFGTFSISGYEDLKISVFYSFDYSDTSSEHFITRNIEKPLDAKSEHNYMLHLYLKPSGKSYEYAALLA